MKEEKIVSLLSALKTKKTGVRAGLWVESHCPLVWKHGGKDIHPSFGVKISEKKKSICKCWSCGYGGDLQDLVLDVGRYVREHKLSGYNLKLANHLAANEAEEMSINPEDIPDYDAPYEPPEITVFSEKWLESFKPAIKFEVAMSYLASRDVPVAMVKELDIRYDPLQRRVCFPFRNFKGELMGVQGRSLDKETTLRYYQYGFNGKRNGTVWLGENHVDLDKPVVLVEGPFDYTSVLRVYTNVVASFTSGLSVEKMKRVSDAESIITLYDYGNGGDSARAAIDKRLASVPRLHLIPSEVEDDAGNMTLSQVTQHLSGHVKLMNFNEAWN